MIESILAISASVTVVVIFLFAVLMYNHIYKNNDRGFK